jgi:hypothetical protein
MTTLAEHSYAEVNHKRAVRYWWIPIPPSMVGSVPGARYNPLLKRHCIETRGAQGYVSRRVGLRITIGKTDEERVKRPPLAVQCYVLGIEGGERYELYPDGTIKRLNEPRSNGETQGVLK